MEKIINYKLSEFILKDEETIQQYSAILELLKPLKSIKNPNKKWWNKNPKMIPVKAIRELSFGEKTLAQTLYNEGTNEALFEIISMIIGLKEKQILGLTIVDFFGIISFIKEELIELNNIEINELSDDSFDFNLEAVNANKRMSRFGIMNTINSLAQDDILRWEQIEKLPYLTVLSKLMMDKEKSAIQKELSELQSKKQNN